MATAQHYRRKARRIAQREGINPTLFERQIQQESGFNPHAGSPAGAQGIAQFMPATARARGVDVNNPSSSLKGAAKLMKEYLNSYHGDWKKALTAYNAGPGAVGRPLPGETQNYIRTIVGGGSGKQGAPGGSGGSRDPLKVSLTPDKLVTGKQQVFDKKGFQSASGLYMLGQIQQRHGRGGVLRRLGVIPTAEPRAQDFTSTKDFSAVQKGQLSITGGGGGGGGGSGDVGGGARTFLQRAVKVSHAKPSYLWGGGHGASPAPLGSRVDCSGYVSQILGVSPRTSTGFMKFGKPGAGKQVTVYANSGHVIIQIGSRFFGTSHSNPGGGAGEIPAPSKQYLSSFVARHPAGL